MKITKLSLCVSMVGLLATLPAAYANEMVTNCTQVSASGGTDTNATNNESCVKLLIPFDYGDAPDPSFQTLNSSGGASHQLGTDVYLGKCVDSDTGLLQGAANADDANQGDLVYGTCADPTMDGDEDGVAMTELHVGDTEHAVQVTANSACKLNAWVDWNNDGSWGGAGEQVFQDQQLIKGLNDLTMNVPEFAQAGTLYARFRCSTAGGDGIGGESADGEVEDYTLNVLPAIPKVPMSLGDLIWDDADHDGKQTANEQPLAGAVVSLLDKDGNPAKDLNGTLVAPVTTGADGKYLFSNLLEGEYSISVKPPEGYIPTLNAGDVDDVPANDDSNCAAQPDGSIKSALISLAAGTEPVDDGDSDANTNFSADCGLYKPAEPTHSLGNKVWVDDGAGTTSNANNGKFDQGETLISDGVVMELRDKDGKVLTSAPTAKGYYLFSGLVAGDYQVCVAASNFDAGGVLVGYKASTGGNETDANANVDNNDNGNDDITAGLCSNLVTLGADEPTGETDTASGTAGDDGAATEDARSNLTVDFGLVPPAAMSVGDRMWVDANKNGQQDETESGLAGAVVTLLDASGRMATDLKGNTVGAITTGADGKYLFSNLPEGEYTLVVEQPEGYLPTKGGVDVDSDASNTDSNCSVAGLTGTLQSKPFTLAAGTEPDGASDTTNNNLTVDCGFYQPDAPTHSVGSRVWVDDGAGTTANANNGLADVGEKPVVDGVVVELKDSMGTLLNSTTTKDGYYLFSGLTAGSYQVCVASSNFDADGGLLAAYKASTGGNVADANTDIDGDDNGSDDTSKGLCSNLVVLDDKEPTGEATAGTAGDDGMGTADNRSNLTVDFGVVPPKAPTPMTVGDRLWIDANNDGQQGADEAALQGAVVTLLDKDGNPAKDLTGNVVASITTGADGKYLFSNLPEGDYTLSVKAPDGYIPTKGGVDADDDASNTDSNFSAQPDGSVKTAPFTLSAGQEPDVAADGDDTNSNLTLDGGFYKPAEPTHSLGNKVWVDDGAGDTTKANNGVFDQGEAAIVDGVVMDLRDKDGNVISSTTTTKGFYLFSGLAAGDYQVCVAARNFYADGGLLASYKASTGGNETDANLNIDGNDNGSDDINTGLCSNLITLGADEPTGETDTASGTAGDDGVGTEDARSNLTVDFGLVPIPAPKVVAVGNGLWIDSNANGLQDAGESPLPFALVTLLDKDGNRAKDISGSVVAQVTTDETGKYLFSNLPEGDYQIDLQIPQGYVLTTGGADPDDNASNNDSNFAVQADGSIRTPVFTLNVGQEPIDDGDTDANTNLSVDGGVKLAPKAVSVGDTIWVDANEDGKQDAGEAPLAGVVITLLDKDGNVAKDAEGNAIAPVTTGETGKYLFSNLPEGDYSISVKAPEGYTPTEGGADVDDDASNVDSNCLAQNDGSLKTALFTLTAGTEPTDDGDSDSNSNLSVDCGLVAPKTPTMVSVGGYLWVDANNDGQQSAEETALSGAVVTLLDKDGNPAKDSAGNDVAAITTGNNGEYLFSNLSEGEYSISVKAPEGYIPTKGGADADDDASNTDSNVSLQADGSVKTAPFTLTAGQEPDVAVDGDDTNGNLTLDGGFYKPTEPTHSIGNIIWVDDGAGTDANANNGIQDNGEALAPSGVAMELRDKDGALVASTQSANGYYLFSGLAAGSYQVCVAATNFATGGALAGYTASLNGDEADANGNIDSHDNGDNTVEDGLCSNLVVLDDQEPTGEAPTASGKVGDDGVGTEDARSNLTVDFGVLPPKAPPSTVAVGDIIWNDVNENGKQDEGETGLSGVVVSLLNADGTPVIIGDIVVSPVTTGSDGKYLFSGLAEGDYIVRVTLPEGYVPSVNAGDVDDVATDGDNNFAVVGSSVQTSVLTLTTGKEPTNDGDTDANTNLSVDGGFYQPKKHSIGNMLWVDNGAGTEANADNGKYDAGESLASDGIRIELRDNAGAMVAATTSKNGYYLFSGLASGSYQVCVAGSNFVEGGLLAGYSGSTGQDTGDTDNNDNGDSTVSDGLCSTVTLLDGKEPTGETPTASGTAGDDGMGTEDARSNLSVDFGLVPPKTVDPTTPVAVGDVIWLDNNANGQQDKGEAGVSGASVTLTDASGRAVTDVDGKAVETQTTGADGKYYFANLPEGEYMVTVVPPSGLSLTLGGLDADDDASNTDSNCRLNTLNDTIQTYPFTLKAGLEPDADGDGTNSNLSVDCGFYGAVSLGDKVWLDTDADGQQDADETGISGVKVSLFDADGSTPATDMNGSAVASVTTDGSGKYLFENLKPGDYVVKVAPGEGYSLTKGGADVDTDTSNTDSNCKAVDDGFQTLPITLAQGTEPVAKVDGDDANRNSTADCGFFRAVSLGQRVWIDLDADGKQDGGEPGVPGATVTLLTVDGKPATDIYGNVVAPQTTDSNGNYLFGNLREGSYLVKVTPPAGYVATTPSTDPNDNDGTDSNGIPQTDGSVITNPIELKWGEEPQNGGASNQTVAFGFVPNITIPTLSQWGTAIMSMLLAVAAFLRRRRED